MPVNLEFRQAFMVCLLKENCVSVLIGNIGWERLGVRKDSTTLRGEMTTVHAHSGDTRYDGGAYNRSTIDLVAVRPCGCRQLQCSSRCSRKGVNAYHNADADQNSTGLPAHRHTVEHARPYPAGGAAPSIPGRAPSDRAP